jgi:hypothetical protein
MAIERQPAEAEVTPEASEQIFLKENPGRNRIGRDEAHDEANMMQARLHPRRQEAFSAQADRNVAGVEPRGSAHEAALLTPKDYEQAFQEIQDLKARADKDPNLVQSLAPFMRAIFVGGLKGLKEVDRATGRPIGEDNIEAIHDAVINSLETAQERLRNLQTAGTIQAGEEALLYLLDIARLNDMAEGGYRHEGAVRQRALEIGLPSLKGHEDAERVKRVEKL